MKTRARPVEPAPSVATCDLDPAQAAVLGDLLLPAPVEVESVVAPLAPAPAPVRGPDQDLIEAFQRGERAAFALVIERNQRVIYGFLRARLDQPDAADDLTQEVFLRAYTRRSTIVVDALLRPWLLGIARNILREHARSLRRRKQVAWTQFCLELDEHVTSDGDELEELLAQLPTCLEGLGATARAAIEMRYSAQMRLAQIGEKLRRSEGAAKLLMFRARQALKNCLDRKCRTAHHDR